MIMEKISKIVFLNAILIVIMITSCKKGDENNQEQQINVAMLAVGNTFDDLGFLQSCKDGMVKAKNDFNLKVEYSIDTTGNKYQEKIDAFGFQDFDLIIAVGFMWNDAVIKAAKKYPNSKFVIVDTELSEHQNNVVSIIFDIDEAAYPLGFLSAWWADSHDNNDPKLGYVGALLIPQIRQFIEPFINGVKRYNQQYGKNIVVLGNYAGDLFNLELGKHISDSLITIGADVIFGVGGETGDGSLLMAKEHKKWGIGVNVDQYYSFPEVSDILLSSAMKGLDNAIYKVVKSFVDDTFIGGSVYKGKLANDGVGIAPYHLYESQIPESIKNEIESIKAGIIKGSIDTGW
jgi:basic membrane protein A